MKNKKFFLIFLIALLFGISVFKLTDAFYFKEIEKIFDLKKLGYENSLIVFENRTYILAIIIFLSAIFSASIFYIYQKREENFKAYLEKVRLRLEKISNGDYSVEIKELEELGDLYDDLYKLILELRIKSEKNYKAKVEIKNALENISHQLKTPIASIEILTELLEEKYDDDYLKDIQKEIHKLNDLISDLLLIARLEANQVNLKREKICAKELVFTAKDSLKNIINKFNVEVEITGEDFEIKGDFSYLTEAFINVIKNSLEHAHKKVEIILRKENTYGEVLIKDDGEGFSKKDLTKIFKRFYKADEESPGAGIGLNISKEIFLKHNATITAKNRDGGVFIIRFF